MTIYVFYRGDDVQFVGTLQECSAHFGVSERSIRYYASPVSRRRAEKAGTDSKVLYAEKVNDKE